MNSMKWVGNHLEIDPPRRPKKITGTRMAGIFGLNKWATPFQMWCEITRTWEKPFVDTIYTQAGKIIEPKQAQFMVDAYGMSNLKTPTDIFGKDYFKTTYGDFFHDVRIFGGMWDYILTDKDGRATTVLEMKTTKRAEDWANDIPEYYAIQAALYAYLLGVDKVIMVATVLKDGDYANPEDFVVTSDNTFVVPFRLSERYPNFGKRIDEAVAWWDRHVVEGVSPDYDPKKDKEILESLRTVSVSPLDSEKDLLDEADSLQTKIEQAKKALKEDEDRLEVLKDWIREKTSSRLDDNMDECVIEGKVWKWTLSRTNTRRVDSNALKKDGLYEKYSTVVPGTKLSASLIKK